MRLQKIGFECLMTVYNITMIHINNINKGLGEDVKGSRLELLVTTVGTRVAGA